jgi:diguanylate cyclase (GGDEF)-like protein/PAS domain S-box-containing protein
VSEASALHNQQAARAKEITTYATGAVYGSAMLALLLFSWQFSQVRRRAALAESDREFMQRSEARFRPLVQGSTDIIAVIDARGVFQYVSPATERLLGAKADDLAGKPIFSMLAAEEIRAFESFLSGILARPDYSASIELPVVSRFGSTSQFEVLCTNLIANPDVGGLVLNMRDVSERKAMEEQLRHMAFHDPLTNLANRVRFMERLGHALARAKRPDQKQLSVLYMDLDNFKNVNDELGHTSGDDLLKEVAMRLLACIGPADTAARLGGDEFAILLEDIDSPAKPRAVAARILDEIARPFVISSQETMLSASIGIVTADGNVTAEELIRNADVAMYDAKESGKGCAHVYAPDMHITLFERLRLVRGLHRAVERKEFVVQYQPTFSLDSQTISGFEALVRWNHPRRGMLEPREFISVAEEIGLVFEIGEYVLDQACRQAKEWQSEHPNHSSLSMSVNVSAKQLQRAGFDLIVQRALAESGLDPRYLTLEITETVLVSQPQAVINTLRSIRSLGVQIALDDFGTGYSSLNYLKEFPIDLIKIDRGFIEGLDRDEREEMLVRNVIDLATMLDLKIVAEGIERPDQLSRLRDLKCGFGQGYLFARPMGVDAVEMLLSKGATAKTP